MEDECTVMRVEAPFYPLESDISRSISRVGDDVGISDDRIVGLGFEIDEEGYCRRVFSTASPSFSIDSRSDAFLWLSTPSDAFLFSADDKWIEPILKWFGEGVVDCYQKCSEGYRLPIDYLRLQYLPDGYVSILSKGKRCKRIYCLKPFYHMSRMLSEVEDAKSTRDKAIRLVSTLLTYSLPQGNMHSPGSILQAYMSKSGVRCLSRVPKEILDAASNCYHTKWATAFKVGSFEKAWDYDISGAFSYHASRVQSCDPLYGKWVEGGYQASACYGFCYAHLKLKPSLSPMMFRIMCRSLGYGRREIRQLNCCGEWDGWITKDEIDYIRDWELGKVTTYLGYWFIPHTDFRPYEGAIGGLFKARTAAKEEGDTFASNICKLVSLTAQGKYLSVFPMNGVLTSGYMRNPIYGSVVVSRTRLQVAEFCMLSPSDVLQVMVDGVSTLKRVPAGDGIGEFRLESPKEGEECIVAGDGQYWMPSRASVLQKDTLEDYADSSTYPSKIAASRFTLGDVVNKMTGFESLGKMRDKYIDIDIAKHVGSSQRSFIRVPEKCRDLLQNVYESEARVI